MPDEAFAVAQNLAKEIAGLRTDVRGAITSFNTSTAKSDRSRKQNRVILGVLVVMMGVVGWVALDNRSTAAFSKRQAAVAAAQAACVRTWANAYTDRTNTLTPLSNDRNSKLDQLITSIPVDSQKQFQAALLTYIRSANTYEQAVQTNPVPLAPKFTC